MAYATPGFVKLIPMVSNRKKAVPVCPSSVWVSVMVLVLEGAQVCPGELIVL